MATFTDIENAILTWVNAITGREVVLADDDELYVPRVPYVLIKLTDNSTPNFMRPQQSSDGLSETVFSSSVVTCQIDVVGQSGGTTSKADAQRLAVSLKSMRRYQDLWKIMGLGAASAITDLTGLETGAFRHRHQFTVTFYAALQETFDADYFNTVDVTINEQTKPYTKVVTMTERTTGAC